MSARSWVVLLAGLWLSACESEPHPIGPLPRANASLSATGSNFIAFYSDRSGGGDIYLYDASTSSLVSLPNLNTDAREVSPSITPDGRFIAFQRTVFGLEDVFLYDRSTSSLVDLPGLNSASDDANPSITPDGRFIAFATTRGGDAFPEDVLLYDRSTSSLVPLPGLNTNGPTGFNEGVPRISADGRFISFRSNRSGGVDHIFLYDRSTSSLVPLPGLNSPTFADDIPSMSADGRFIAFQSDRSGTLTIYLYDRTKSALVPLPGLGSPASTPSISPDGRFIAFVSPCNGLADVFVYDRTTSSLVGLPGLNQSGTNDHYPSIAFSGSLSNPNPFELQCRLIRGIAYDAGVLWITHSAPDVSNVIRISKIDPGTGATLAESNDLNWNGRGITAGGGSLWVADALADVVHRVDPSNFSEIGSPFNTPGSEPTGIAFDGSDLWLTDPPLQRIYHLNTSGTVLGSFSIANGGGQGLEWEGNGMWTNTGASEQSHYLTNGTIDATRTFQGLPNATTVGDIALGNGKVYIPAGDIVYTQDWSPLACDPYEPNDNIGQARPISLGTSVTQGKICTATDVDYFAFEVPTNQVLFIEMTPPPGMDYQVSLRGAGDNVLASSNNPSDLHEVVVYSAQPGTYFLRVEGVNGAFDPGNSYSISWPAGFLSFPLENRAADVLASPTGVAIAKINSVFDHSYNARKFGMYCANDEVMPYTAEKASIRSDLIDTFGCEATPGKKNDLYGFKAPRGSRSSFQVNGNYSGLGTLYYDGHPGYDFNTTDADQDPVTGQIRVLAAADGVVECVFTAAAPKSCGGFYPGAVIVNHNNGYRTIYVHLSSATPSLVQNAVVHRNDVVGMSGKTGTKKAHLHFQVERILPGPKFVPVDPYGWSPLPGAAVTVDPYTDVTGVRNIRLWR